jgi:4-hydroxy-3-polyprenylbenzoate decarboxylase
MVALAEMGAIISPPVPAFYHKPKDIDDIINHTIGRLLDIFNIEANMVRRWNGL